VWFRRAPEPFSRGNSGAGRENRIASRVGRADLAGCAVTGHGWRSSAGLRRANSTRLWATAADQILPSWRATCWVNGRLTRYRWLHASP
jgi:hypothetical protein